MLRCFNNSMTSFLCTAVVAESCFLVSDKKELNTSLYVCDYGAADDYVFVGAIKWSIKIHSIETDRLLP